MNRSLKKIQTVLDTVQGVEGRLKFDPSVGALVAGGSIIQEIDAHKALMFPEKSIIKDPEPVTAKERDKRVLDKGGSRVVKSKHSSSLIDGDDGVVEHNHPTSSGFTGSSDGSGTMMHGSSQNSKSFENQKQHSKGKSTIVDNSGSRIHVKATYGEDAVRFKFDPSGGCSKLYEEVATRFKLQNGSFQLKYLDDEEEWVMLLDDSDLQECLEILHEIGTCSVKFLVRDMPCNLSSSSSSSCYLGSS